ncbi:hypothetical protein SCYAM73S_08496 [Streptomyces cyaneofuscatus]
MRSRAVWLKSTKMRSPRSSFHHAVVTRSGIRRSSSRPAAMAARRTSVKVQAGSMGTKTCIPRPPEVLGQPRTPWSSRTERSSWAAVTASA